MPKFDQEKAILLIRKYRPQTLEDISKLPISDEEKNLMHSQFKIDFVFNDAYNKSKEYGPEFYNEQNLISQYGKPSFNRHEVEQMIQMEEMSKALGR
jgi:hypothetical protein